VFFITRDEMHTSNTKRGEERDMTGTELVVVASGFIIALAEVSFFILSFGLI
jgi:hypothetical protein